MVYHSKGIRSSPHSAPSATASKESFPFRTNTDPMPTIYRLHKTDQFRTVGKCTGIQWHPETFFRIQHGLHTVPFSIYRAQCHDPSVFTQYELNDPL